MKPHFTGPLVIEEIGYELWRVVREFEFYASDGGHVKVPAGFVTDLASVPHLARSIIPKIGYWSQPAVVHDCCYRMHRTGMNTKWTRKQMDQWFLEGMKLKADQYDVSLLNRRHDLIYTGVRMGSLASWETPQEREERFAKTEIDYD